MDEIITISRHRMGTDGNGVTTLIGFWGCPLSCKYCLNDFCHDEKIHRMVLSPQELYDRVSIDNIYFKMTGGGIVFGGGEPLLHSQYISEMIQLCPQDWNFRIETSLNVPAYHVKALMPMLDEWIIDVKDLNPEIYLNYTQRDNQQMLDNIQLLCSQVPMEKILFRVPLIPGYNTLEDVRKSAVQLTGKGRINRFTYQTETRK